LKRILALANMRFFVRPLVLHLQINNKISKRERMLIV